MRLLGDLGEEFGVDDHALSVFGREFCTNKFGHTFSAVGNRAEFQIREVVPLQPDTSVKDSDNGVIMVRFGPEVEELRVPVAREGESISHIMFPTTAINDEDRKHYNDIL